MAAAAAAAMSLRRGIARWRRTRARRRSSAIAQMISDPMSNPGFLAVDRGEALWSEKRGTKNVSLETCDLGLGAGKLEGAFAKLPRYFEDADRVMDLEQRLLWCMEKVQGLDTKDVIARRFSGPGRASDMEDLVAFIANKSNGMKIDMPLSHPKEQEMAAVGEAMFYRRGGVNGFLLRDLPCRRRQAHPPAGAAEPLQARQAGAGDDGRLADLSRVAGRAAHDAASAVGLLPPATLAGAGIWFRRHHRADRVPATSRRPAARSTSPRSSAEERDMRSIIQNLPRLVRGRALSLPFAALAQNANKARRSRPSSIAYIKSTFGKAPPEWQARIEPDETLKACNRYAQRRAVRRSRQDHRARNGAGSSILPTASFSATGRKARRSPTTAAAGSSPTRRKRSAAAIATPAIRWSRRKSATARLARA